MPPQINEQNFDEKLQERFKTLPKALQNAITSADVQDKLRELSDRHKLHIDKWQKLEREVMLALLGFQKMEDLENNIKREVGLPSDAAARLVEDIGENILNPIHDALERELGPLQEEKPAKDAEPTGDLSPTGKNDVEKVPGLLTPKPASSPRPSENVTQTTAQDKIDALPPRPIVEKPVASSPQPAAKEINSSTLAHAPSSPVPSTPPPAPPMAKSVRAVPSPEYAPNSKSHERKTVDDDPYRESIA